MNTRLILDKADSIKRLDGIQGIKDSTFVKFSAFYFKIARKATFIGQGLFPFPGHSMFPARRVF
ncbi:MAG: hypothetical protein ACE5E9_02230 [Nitrospinaceae bacterium]